MQQVAQVEPIIKVGATEHQATVVRALSRICAVFVTFQGRPPYPSLLCSHNPSAVAGGERLLEWSVHIGSKKWPEMTTCKSTAATMSLLKQALGTYDQAVACTSITPANYFNDRYVIGVPTSTIPNESFAGTSTRSGDLLSVLIKGMGRRGGEIRRRGGFLKIVVWLSDALRMQHNTPSFYGTLGGCVCVAKHPRGNASATCGNATKATQLLWDFWGLCLRCNAPAPKRKHNL